MSASNRRRKTTTERGYGHVHQQVRARVARLVATGTATCTRCGQTIDPWEPWDLDHHDDRRRGWLGAAHRDCNRRAGALKNRREPEQAPLTWSRAWCSHAPPNRPVILNGRVYEPGEPIGSGL
jgi:hypothetical protein